MEKPMSGSWAAGAFKLALSFWTGVVLLKATEPVAGATGYDFFRKSGAAEVD
jgi:hypothetical protein